MRKDVNIAVIWSREENVDGRHDYTLQIFKSYHTVEGSLSVVGSVRNSWLKAQQGDSG